MKKKFAVTLICLTTILYGSVFAVSRNNGTRFLDEINNQLMRLHGIFSYSEQVGRAKKILAIVLEHEAPPDGWPELLESSLRPFGDKAFYFSKIWLVESGLSTRDIENSYPVRIIERREQLVVILRFPGTGHLLQFNLFEQDGNSPVSGLILPLGDAGFSADYNNDDRIDRQDLLLARKRHDNG